MVSVPTQSAVNPQVAKSLCRVVGFACVVGFLFDILMLSFPISWGSAWRVGILQQMGDRSIVLLFGIALILYGYWEVRSWRKSVAYLCLGTGVLFLLCSILVIRDTLSLQNQAITSISDQALQLQTQIEEGRSNLEVTASVTPEQLDEALQQIATQADALKQNAKAGITKTGVVSTGNLLIVGVSLLGLGRMGIPRSRKKESSYK